MHAAWMTNRCPFAGRSVHDSLCLTPGSHRVGCATATCIASVGPSMHVACGFKSALQFLTSVESTRPAFHHFTLLLAMRFKHSVLTLYVLSLESVAQQVGHCAPHSPCWALFVPHMDTCLDFLRSSGVHAPSAPTMPHFLVTIAAWYPCRVDWSPLLEHYPMTAAVSSAQGQLLFKGLAAKVCALCSSSHCTLCSSAHCSR